MVMMGKRDRNARSSGYECAEFLAECFTEIVLLNHVGVKSRDAVIVHPIPVTYLPC